MSQRSRRWFKYTGILAVVVVVAAALTVITGIVEFSYVGIPFLIFTSCSLIMSIVFAVADSRPRLKERHQAALYHARNNNA